jgi:NADPH:quinone reductase-like Zn-dependent oxidoreductase
MKAIWVTEKSPSPNDIQVSLDDMPKPAINKDQCLIEVQGSGVNQSDVKMILGVMPNTVWPRTPGRDYAGVVVDGPQELIGKSVWGSGGDLGNSRNGAHAEYVVVETESVHERPSNISAHEAAGVGVPFCTAYLGLIREANITADDTVVVLGLNGTVGEAVTQIATMVGARVIGVQRSSEPYAGHTNSPVDIIDSTQGDVVEKIRALTGGKGANVVFNTVGDPYFTIGNLALASQGYHFIISNIKKEVTLDISQLYRNRTHLVGIASTFYNSCELGEVLEKLRPGFESGQLKPFSIHDESVYALDNAKQAYESVINGLTRNRVILDPKL